MKIAVMGSAPSSVGRAPFKNAAYQQFTQGKVEELRRAHGDVPGEFEIWGCSPGLWAVTPRATRWFEIHRWEPHQPWFSGEYVSFLQKFPGPLYTGGRIPEFPNHVIFPIDAMEEKFGSYFFTSSIALMMALAIDTIEKIREARRAGQVLDIIWGGKIDPAEFSKPDSDDIIGLWGVDMAANEEYGFQRPGCQFFLLEAMRRGIKVYLPPESDLARPMPVYGISEWDHNYVKLTSRARELNAKIQELGKQARDSHEQLIGAQGEMMALNYFVNTWTSPYGMQHGIVIEQAPGTGLGSGITSFDGRTVARMATADDKVLNALAEAPEVQMGRRVMAELFKHVNPEKPEQAIEVLQRLVAERDVAVKAAQIASPDPAPRQKAKRRRR